LLRRAQVDALRGTAGGLDLTARALETEDAEEADRALAALRGVRDRLSELARLREASGNVAGRSAIWRSQRTPLVRERENANELDLLPERLQDAVRQPDPERTNEGGCDPHSRL